MSIVIPEEVKQVQHLFIEGKNEEAFARQMGGMVALLVAIIVGVMVFYSINEGVQMNINSVGPHNYEYQAQWNTTNTTASTVFTLLPIVAVVIIAGIILAVVTRFGGGGGI